ncbi:MAG TPA: PstS family phosphate ABC transporter substrate-binding protein [Candidatus Lokiarchaeia archaeon]|nr:PstS family phosphate ABC transporter substrate-binding protein [Candidatus Lokiarchaeia archaeon]
MEGNSKIAIVAVVVAAGALFGGLLIGYGAWGINTQNTNPNTTNYTLKLAGSTTVFPIATDAAQVFMNEHANYNIVVSAGGSGIGIAACENGTCDIGMSSKTIGAGDLAQGLNVTTVALDGIAIIISTKSAWNNVTQLTTFQVRGIYNGTYTNWNQVGGPNHAIDVYERESGSGTRSSFETFIMPASITYVGGILTANGSPLMNSSVANDQYAIGYIGLGFVTGNPTVKAMNIEKSGSTSYIACTFATVQGGTYPLARALFMFVKGDMTAPEQEFLNFMRGPVGQQSVIRQGFVPITAI